MEHFRRGGKFLPRLLSKMGGYSGEAELVEPDGCGLDKE
jgi:hypothetical protein